MPSKNRRTPNERLPIGDHKQCAIDKTLKLDIIAHHHERCDIYGA
jgi:hypothetical protein